MDDQAQLRESLATALRVVIRLEVAFQEQGRQLASLQAAYQQQAGRLADLQARLGQAALRGYDDAALAGGF